MATLSLRNVKKSYGDTAVIHGIDLEVAAGEFIVIVGPSGCGKSTLLRMVAGLETITAGELFIGAVILATGADEHRPTEYLYGQDPRVLTQRELEQQIADGTLATVQSVVMIQCVDSREEPRNYCSRICCDTSLKDALCLKGQNPDIDIYIFYRDIMAYGFVESYYTQHLSDRSLR